MNCLNQNKRIFLLVIFVFVFSFFIFDISQALPDYVHTTLISGNKKDYEIGVCKNTGTIYKFINKRSGSGENTIHEHFGAACQIAVHSGAPGSLTPDACSWQGYWNPTQSGAACYYPGQGYMNHKTPLAGVDVDVYCDGALNNNCNSANNTIDHSSHRMMNFDYGPNYQGPYHTNDLLYLEQKVALKNTYVQIDLEVINKGIERGTAFEIPTYYFIEKYEKYYFADGSEIIQGIVPNSTTGPATTGNFITVENPNKTNSSITIAWSYSNQFISDTTNEYAHIRRAPWGGKNWVKYNNVAGVSLKTNQPYQLRYLLIPYKYNEIIETEFGNISVLELIEKKKLSADGSVCPDCKVEGQCRNHVENICANSNNIPIDNDISQLGDSIDDYWCTYNEHDGCS
ncbi:MAG: hypothetical protein ISS87_02005, partial [Candidatus Pacebacteria bacterium]|nr:hypothetical protein [Candidatus Paceibacterota bacterium]